MAPVCSSVPVNLDSVTANESRTPKLTPLNSAIVILDVFGPVLLSHVWFLLLMFYKFQPCFVCLLLEIVPKKLCVTSLNNQNQAEIHVVFSHVHALCFI